MVNRFAVPCLIAAVLAASVSAVPAPQGVTALVAPPSAAPEQCSVNGNRVYGLAIHAIGGSKQKRQLVSQIADGQIQANPAAEVVPAAPLDTGVTPLVDGQIADEAPVENIGTGAVQLPDGQVLAPPESGDVVQIPDGQIQAPPVIQIPDGQIQAPPAIQIPDGQIQAPPAVQIPDGQIQAPPVIQIPDGQIQAPPAIQIPDGQIQVPAAVGPVTQIADGQIQAPAEIIDCKVVEKAPATGFGALFSSYYYKKTVETVSEPVCGCPEVVVKEVVPPIEISSSASATFEVPAKGLTTKPKVVIEKIPIVGLLGKRQVTQIADGQIQANEIPIKDLGKIDDCGIKAIVPPVTDIDTGVIGIPDVEIPVYEAPAKDVDTVVTQIPDGQVQANEAPVEDLDTAVTQIPDGQIQANLVKRQNGVPLAISLNKGVLTDALGRTGYVAEGRQIQFDSPPQSGAIFTGGWSVCDDGSLALGEQKEFYACGSSDFNNLYDQPVFPDNCHPVTITMV